MTTRAVVLVGLFLASLSSPLRADTVLFQDGAFAPADWDLGGVTTGYYEGAGGNPGQFREVSNTVHDASPYSTIMGFHRYIPARYDPSVSGAILSIDYSESALMLRGAGDGQATGPAVRQGGIVYYYSMGGTAYGTWQSLSATGLVAEDFRNTPYDNQHPDFSNTAPPLEIGFFRGNSTFSAGYTIVSGIDNWSVTVHAGGSTTAVPGIPAIEGTWGNLRALYR